MLMDAIDSLRLGIVTRKWSDVIRGFELLTGESLSVESEVEATITTKPLILKGAFRDTPDFSVKKDGGKTAERRTKANGTNRFKPGQYKIDEEPGAELLNDNVTPTPRERPRSEIYTVMCADCDKNIELSPFDAARVFAKGSLYNETGEYRCDVIKCGKKCPNQ